MSYRLLQGDALDVLETLEPKSVHCVVTSPPYWGLRDYGTDGQLGLEATPEEYVRAMVSVFDRVWRVLRDDGVCFINLGDSYASGDTRPSRSRFGVPAYDKDGKELLGCLLTGSSCLGPCGGPTACHLFHNADMIRRQRISAPDCEKIDHGNGCQDSSVAVAFAPGVPASTIPSSTDCVADASSLSGGALELQTEQPTSSACEHLCEHKRVDPCEHPTSVGARQDQPLHTSCTSETVGALADRTKGTAFDWFSCPYYTTTFRHTQLKPKDLVGIPWRVAFALQAYGWYLRSDIVWAKGLSFCPEYSGSVMPESVTDRCTKSHEYLFMLTKRERYYFDSFAVREPAKDWGQRNRRNGSAFVDGTPGRSRQSGGKDCDFAERGRNLRDVWAIATEPFPGSHFAVFPQALVKPCVLAGTSERGVCPACGKPWERVTERENMEVRPGPSREARSNGGQLRTQVNGTMVKPPTSTTTGWRAGCGCDAGEPVPATVLDPFCGSGTTGLVALTYGRDFIGIDLSPEYLAMAERRIAPAAAQEVLAL